MKRLIFILIGVVVLASCQKENDPLFDKSADERIDAKLKEYSELLVSAEYGWKTEYFPGSLATGGWSYLFKFKENGVVSMMSDFNPTTASTEQESSYRISMIHKPSLIFDTYSSFHILSDPSLAQQGKGLKGDFEFEIEEFKNDTLYLVGHYDKSILKLVRATAEDVNLKPRIAKRAEFKKFFMNPNAYFFKTLTVGSTPVDVSYDDKKKRLTFKYVKEGVTITETRALAFSNNEAVLSTPLNLPNVGAPIKSIPFSLNDNGSITLNMDKYGVKATLNHSDLPVVPYLDGIRDIRILGLMNVLNISPSLRSLLPGMEAIPNFKDIQFYFGFGGFNEIAIYAPNPKEKVFYDYNIEWNYGKDGVLRAKYLGPGKTLKSDTYEPNVKPFIDRICDGDGFIVLDIKGQAVGQNVVFTVTLVSRSDSNDRIELYTMQ